MGRLLLLPWLALALACGGEGEPLPPPPPAGDLEIGTTGADLTGFVALTDGQSVDLAAGAQGGFHVYLNLRLPAAAMPEGTRRVTVERRAARKDGAGLVSRATHSTELVADPSAQLSMQRPALMFLCPTPVGIAVADQALEVEAELKDAEGQTLARGRISLVPRCPVDQEAFCRRICAG